MRAVHQHLSWLRLLAAGQLALVSVLALTGYAHPYSMLGSFILFFALVLVVKAPPR